MSLLPVLRTRSTPVNGAPATVQSMRLPLGRVALCLDCEVCFELGTGACPSCGSRTWVPVASFLRRSVIGRLHGADASS